MDNQSNVPAQGPDVGFERDEDFVSLYANNARFENSVWDLKIIFGQLDQSVQPAVVRQHTAVSVPWFQAKLMAYYLEANIAIYEAEHGTINVPRAVAPPAPDAAAPEIQDNQLAIAVADFLSLVHHRLFGRLHEPQTSPATAEAPSVGPEPSE